MCVVSEAYTHMQPASEFGSPNTWITYRGDVKKCVGDFRGYSSTVWPSGGVAALHAVQSGCDIY